MRVAGLVSTALFACGSSSTTPDAAPDTPVTPVESLSSCPSSVSATVSDSPTMFVPATSTIPQRGVVKFEITTEHFVVPNNTTTTHPALSVGRGETKCLKFNAPGSYGFACGVHGFTGTIVVQ